jgi:hypothetical protein
MTHGVDRRRQVRTKYWYNKTPSYFQTLMDKMIALEMLLPEAEFY